MPYHIIDDLNAFFTRELLYKPVVVACGHMACFWCIFKAMYVCEECPVCRTPCNYFPRICRLLHLILWKLYPATYARRQKEVSEKEEKSGNASQQFDDLKLEASDSVSCELLSDSLKSVRLGSETAREAEAWTQKNEDGSNMEVVMSDLTRAICKHLLFRPVVLNCGDVYCEACTFNSVKRDSSLDHVRPSRGSNKPAHSMSSANAYSSWLTGQGPVVHFAGCDYCGMCPIIGQRYRCKDCKEKMGFDLCEGCYNSSCKLPGRFNQQHTEDHEFEIMEPSMVDVIRMFAAAGNGLDDQITLFTPEELNLQDGGSDQARELEEEPPFMDGSEETPLNNDSLEDEGSESRTRYDGLMVDDYWPIVIILF
ncbi:hypothetical protein LIER_05948 [Lithospermum erythrorhizon]|uniref:ZZ-type domain-containing protein n=1 Tax=Lithospermum erythrorhizon TaxID=34254 RepID=A0AAV3P2F1_LITER